MRGAHVVWVNGFLLALLLLPGCGDSNFSQVGGKVTVDDRPLEEGTISFFPVDGKTTTSGGDIKGGKYSVKVPVGNMAVKISMPKIVGMKKLYDTPDSPAYPVKAE